METLFYIGCFGVGIGILVGITQGRLRRAAAERVLERRDQYQHRQKTERAERAQLAISQLVDRFFPFVRSEWQSAGHSDYRERLRRALKAIPGVVLGAALIGFDAVFPDSARRQHLCVLGKSGFGKTTIALHMIQDDLARGRGLCILGSEAEFFRDWLLPMVPADRARDVIYFKPADPACTLTWNPLSLEDGEDQALAAGEMFSIFKRAIGETTIGARADAILSSAFGVLVGRRGATLWSVMRLLQDGAYRATVVADIEDTYLKEFWTKTFPGYPAGAVLPLANRFNQFLRMPQLRAALCHPISSFSIKQALSDNHILYLDLSGLDPDSTRLVGQVVLSKFQIELFRRERIPESSRSPVHVYVDEFHVFAGAAEGTWRELLARGRRYALALHLLTQHPDQLPKSLQREIFGNVSSVIALNLSATDAASVRREFLVPDSNGVTKPVPAEDFVSLPVGEGFARLGAGACALRVRFAPPIDHPDPAHGRRIRDISWKNFAAPPLPKEEPVAPVTAIPAPIYPTGSLPEPTPGRGSGQHKMLQQLAKQWGEDRGFRASLEENILGGAGRVDLVLEQGDVRIAVEICLTNSPAEVSDTIGRCLASGFAHVVVVTTGDADRSRFAKKALAAITAKDRDRVQVVSADGLRLFLDGLSDPKASGDRSLGYTVRVQAPPPARLRHRRELAGLVGAALLRRSSPS